MGVNAKEISVRLCKMLVALYNKSCTFVQRYPVVSGVFSVFFIFYISLSYIYSFLVYLSPFILVTAIFIRIFWSSEQPQLRYVKRQKRRSDFKHSRVASKYGRSDFALDRYYTYSSHNTTSRRRKNSRDKKWGLHNEFSNSVSDRNTENKGATSLERSRDSSSNNGMPAKNSISPKRQTLRSEPSMSDLVCHDILELEGIIRDIENKEPKDDRIKDVVEWPKMDLGFSELQRKTRMETFMANRKARKELKMQLDKGVNPSHHLAPVFVTRNINSVGSKGFEEFNATEMPDSAPSIIPPSRTFNLLYDPSQEKPTFLQESSEGHQKDKQISRHQSFGLGRLKRFPDKGNHDRLIEQLFCKEYAIFERDESGLKETDMADMKGKGVENALPKMSVSVLRNSNNGSAEIDQKISGFQRAVVSEKPKPRAHNKASSEGLFKFPISNSTTINESLFKSLTSPIEKENMFYAGRQIRKTPANSIASDSQVEVSEVGSPTKAFDGPSSSSDEESSVYDGDNERDNSSGSDDIWGNSVHVREAHRVGDFDETPKSNINSNKDFLSQFSLQEVDEENSADVSSVSSTCELPGDTPTCAVSYDHNIFCDMKETATRNETDQPLNSLDVSSSQAKSERLEEWISLYENYTKEAEDVKDVSDSATIDRDHIDYKTSSGDPGLSTLQQKSIAAISVQSNSSFSPRSVLPKKNLTDEVSSYASDQQIYIQVPQSEMVDMAKTTSSGELHFEVISRNTHPLAYDPSPTVHSHNGDFDNSQTSHDEAKSDIEAKKDVQGNSAHLAEKGGINLTNLGAETSSVSIPNEEKVPLNKEKEVGSQTLVNQESTAEPFMNDKTMDSKSSNNYEGKRDDLKENEAVVSSESERESNKLDEPEHSEEPRPVLQPKNFMPDNMQAQIGNFTNSQGE